MNEKKNLGRGLGDLMDEVSAVRAMPSQPAADINASFAAAKASDDAAPRPETAAAPAPAVIEERPADSEIARKHEQANAAQMAGAPEERVVEKIVKQPVVPLWTKVAVASLACFVLALAAVLYLMRESAVALRADLKTKSDELMATQAQLADAQAALKADPLAWTAEIRCKGARIERDGKIARVVFENPFFTSGVKWAPGADQTLLELLRQIATHSESSYLTVVGHAGRQPLPPRSGFKDNYDLGLRRAESVVDQLVRIVRWPVQAVSTRSDGDKYPPYRGTDPLSQARNKTVSIEIRPRS